MDQETQQTVVQHIADSAAAKAATATYAAAGFSIWFGLTVTEWGVVVATILGIGTFALNAWFQWDRRKRELREYAARMRALSEDRRVDNIGHDPERRK